MIRGRPLMIWGAEGNFLNESFSPEPLLRKHFSDFEKKFRSEGCQKKKIIRGNLHHAPPQMINGQPLNIVQLAPQLSLGICFLPLPDNCLHNALRKKRGAKTAPQRVHFLVRITPFFPKHDYEEKNGPSLPKRGRFPKRLL